MIALPVALESRDNGTPKYNHQRKARAGMSRFEQFIEKVTGGELLASIIAAAIMLVIIMLVSHLLTRWLRHRMKSGGHAMPSGTIVINIMRIIVWGCGICIILDSCFDVNMTGVIAALGVGGIALSLGFQDTLSNLIGGVQVSFMRIVSPGDNIQVGSNTGVVQDVTWRHTTIKNRLGETVIIPNSVISKNAVMHLAAPEQVTVQFVATTAEDLDLVAARTAVAARNALAGIAELEGEPVVVYTELLEEGAKGKVVVTIADSSKAVAAADAIMKAITPILRA